MNYPAIEEMTPLLIAGHHQAFAAIKAERSSLPTGVTLNIIDFAQGSTESSYKEIRQKAYGEWIDAVRRSGDFVGAQVYRQLVITGKGEIAGAAANALRRSQEHVRQYEPAARAPERRQLPP
jgi:gamma-glutamylcysteine synthetase